MAKNPWPISKSAQAIQRRDHRSMDRKKRKGATTAATKNAADQRKLTTCRSTDRSGRNAQAAWLTSDDRRTTMPMSGAESRRLRKMLKARKQVSVTMPASGWSGRCSQKEAASRMKTADAGKAES